MATKLFGLEWPPTAGWKHTVIGKQISDDARARFEQALRARQVRREATMDLFR